MSEFSISISTDAVDVSYTPSVDDPHRKLFGFLFTLSIDIVLASAFLFLPGKHGAPSMWHTIVDAPSGSPAIFTVVFLCIALGLVGWQGFLYDRAAFASDEMIHCDRKAITISRIPWFDFSNRTWRTHTYLLSEVSGLRFAVIASGKNTSYWGVRFRAHGRKWMLPGLKAEEAKKILLGLRELGADVPDDPKLDKRIQQSLEMRPGYTGWMDRSWMDSNKQ
jgi:hypothetical protein